MQKNCRRLNVAAVGQTYNIFRYDAIRARNWSHRLSNALLIYYVLRYKLLVQKVKNTDTMFIYILYFFYMWFMGSWVDIL